MTAVATQSELGQYDQLILLGLLLSLFGDIFLMLKRQQFILGLVSFLLAHLIYCWAFVSKINTTIDWTALTYFSLPAILYYCYLYTGLGKLKIPVLIYVSAIVAMTLLSFSLYQQANNPYALAGFIGAIVFMISDATLALNKFKIAFKSAQPIILSTYYLAQWGIAYSTIQ